MTPKWATSKGTRYFYYECTSVGHRGKEACRVKSIPAKAFEEVILKKIDQISQNEILLHKILNEANSKSKKELEELEKERVLLNLRIFEVKQRGKRLVDRLLEAGEEYSRFIKEEMKEKEEELKELEEHLSQIKTKIEHSRNYLINAEVVKEGLQYFNKIFDDLSPTEKKYLLKLLIKEIVFTK
jgi:site-specific DNA recombinase